MNKVTLFGRVGKDPELRYTPSGTAVANFSLATSERFKDQHGNRQEKTTWHNIVAWKNTAEIAAKYVQKGDQLLVEGKIDVRSYDDRDGNKRYVTEIVISSLELVGGQRQDGSPGQQSRDNQQGGGMNHEPAFNPDDDIPFAIPQCYREVVL